MAIVGVDENGQMRTSANKTITYNKSSKLGKISKDLSITTEKSLFVTNILLST